MPVIKSREKNKTFAMKNMEIMNGIRRGEDQTQPAKSYPIPEKKGKGKGKGKLARVLGVISRGWSSRFVASLCVARSGGDENKEDVTDEGWSMSFLGIPGAMGFMDRN